MKYKLVDVEHIHEDGVGFGTCELCEWIGSLDYDVLTFEDEDKEKYRISTGEWDWGDFYEYLGIDNYILFAEFIQDREYPEVVTDERGGSNKRDIVVKMVEDYNDMRRNSCKQNNI